MSGQPRRVMISAGETSGDKLGAGLAAALKRRDASIELIGMGGQRMREAGVRVVQGHDEVSVVGISEVLTRLPGIRRAMARLDALLERERPDLLVPIDFPEFNLNLAKRAGRRGTGVVYFVSPQLWAWRPGRVDKIRERVLEMLVLFEFESEFYARAGVPVTWVGHPLAERPAAPDASELRRRSGLAAHTRVVALAPGSRDGEIERHMSVLLAAARQLTDEGRALEFLVPLAPGAPEDRIRSTIRASGLERVRVHAGDFPDILGVCAAGAVTSGTATLEAATVGLPMAVIYRLNPLTYWIGKRLVCVDHVAMPNLIAGRRIVPELLQGDCNPSRVAAELRRFLDDAAYTASVREELAAVTRALGEPGVFERAADRVLARLPPG